MQMGVGDANALMAAGFAADAAINLSDDMLDLGFASIQGDYVVLIPLICTIRLPDITTNTALSDADIVETILSVNETDVPGMAAIMTNHIHIERDFGAYVRKLGAEISCDGPNEKSIGQIAYEIQGIENAWRSLTDLKGINSELVVEYDLIAMAAGWHLGAVGMARGEPRPPLCHYAE